MLRFQLWLRYTLLALFALCLLLPGTVLAQSNEETQQLALAKKSILDLRDLNTAGLISKAEVEDGTQHFIAQLTTQLKRPVTLEEVMAAPDPVYSLTPKELTWLQRAAGYVNAVTVLWFLAAVIGVISFSVIFGTYVARLIRYLKNVPMVVYQLAFFALSALLLVWGWFTPDPVRMYMVFLGSLLFAAALIFASQTWKFVETPFNFAGILFVVWGAVALLYGSSVIGFMTIIALLSALGFSIAVEPLSYGIGFRDESAVGKATTAAFILLAVFVGMNIFRQQVPELRIFEFGALFLGSFVGYLGLIIASSRWYPNQQNRVMMQAVTIVAGVAAIFIGLGFGIGVLAKIGGTFFVLWGIEKMMEIRVKDRLGYAWLGMGIFATVTALSLFVFYNQELFAPILFLPK